MSARVATACQAAVFSLLLGVIAQGQTVRAASPAENTIEQLVIGDAYTIDVKRYNVQERYEGFLLKANDRWIVLGNLLSEGRAQKGGPPVFQTVWKWIPREAATIQGRVRTKPSRPLENPPSDSPPLDTSCTVELVEREKLSHLEGVNLTQEANGRLIWNQTRVELGSVGVPYMRDIPYLGTLFRKSRSIVHEIHQPLDDKDVLCIATASGALPEARDRYEQAAARK